MKLFLILVFAGSVALTCIGCEKKEPTRAWKKIPGSIATHRGLSFSPTILDENVLRLKFQWEKKNAPWHLESVFEHVRIDFVTFVDKEYYKLLRVSFPDKFISREITTYVEKIELRIPANVKRIKIRFGVQFMTEFDLKG